MIEEREVVFMAFGGGNRMAEFSRGKGSRGWIEVIVGSMFSGKTEELIRRIRRAQYARQKVQVFKPKIDNRYHVTRVTSHDQTSIEAHIIESISELWDKLTDRTQIVAIDEGQFFSAELVQVAQDLANRGLRVIVAGLDTDWQGQPFEPMPRLMAVAENVTKQHAVCMVCGTTASRTQKIAGGDSKIEVGAAEAYEARCRDHFIPRVDQAFSNFDEPAAHV